MAYCLLSHILAIQGRPRGLGDLGGGQSVLFEQGIGCAPLSPNWSPMLT